MLPSFLYPEWLNLAFFLRWKVLAVVALVLKTTYGYGRNIVVIQYMFVV